MSYKQYKVIERERKTIFNPQEEEEFLNRELIENKWTLLSVVKVDNVYLRYYFKKVF